MTKLTPLNQIAVPVPPPDQEYGIRILDREFQFQGLKKLLAAADYSKAGDRNAGLAASSEVEREAARAISTLR